MSTSHYSPLFFVSVFEEPVSKEVKACAPLTKLPETLWKQLHSRKFREYASHLFRYLFYVFYYYYNNAVDNFT